METANQSPRPGLSLCQPRPWMYYFHPGPGPLQQGREARHMALAASGFRSEGLRPLALRRF